ncbi:MAG: hypothetical protein WCG85_23945 [Polyangia bacterium]
MTKTIERFRDHDAKKMVESVGEAIHPIVSDAGKTIIKQVEDGASAIGGKLVAGAQEKVDVIVERSIRTTLREASALLAKESPLVTGVERAVEKTDQVLANVNQTIERAHRLVPHLRDLAGLNEPDKAKQTMEDIKKTTQNLKAFVEGATNLIPQLNEVLKEWHAEKERERQFNWRVVLGNTAAGLLFVTFAYAIYLKLGWKVTPVRAISLFWLGISIPIMLHNIRSVLSVWKAARAQNLASEVHAQVFNLKSATSVVVFMVLVAGNLLLNLWL